MQYYENKICLEYDELVPDIIKVDNYNHHRKNKNITVYGLGGNGREVLISYDSLQPKYKEAVQKKYGDPKEYIAKQPILNIIENDYETRWKAGEFYNDYILPCTNKHLPEALIPKYTQAACWLNAIDHLTTNKRALKEALNCSVADFWRIVTELIQVKEVPLPASEKRLAIKLKQYKKDGFKCLVEAWRFGNDYSKKVKDDDGVAEALLIKLLSNDHQHDDTVVARCYNEWAKANKLKTITPTTVGNWRRKSAPDITLERDGSAAFYSNFSKRAPRNRPSAPLLLINSDDNILDLYFKKGGNSFYRPALYVVLDGYNDYILGYAIGDTVTKELVYEAYRNAIHHVMELTGGAYLWNQIQTDKWGIDPKKEGELATFFKKQAHFTPATTKVAQSKLIERSFGAAEWHQTLKKYPNYSGHNITSKEKLSPEAIQKASKNAPDAQFIGKQVAHFIDQLRHATNQKTGVPRQQEWLNAFQESEKSKQKLISAEKRLQLFGKVHTHSNKITASGLVVSINNIRYNYEIPADHYLDNVGKTVQITYDPYDMGVVLITDSRGLRFTANSFENLPGALADFKEGDRTRLNGLLEEKKRINTTVIDAIADRANKLKRSQIDTESMLQAGVVLKKELAHNAQRGITSGEMFKNEQELEEEVFDWRKNL